MERTHLRELPFIIIIILIGAVQQWIERVVPKIISNIQRSSPHLFITLSFVSTVLKATTLFSVAPFISSTALGFSTSLTTQHRIELDAREFNGNCLTTSCFETIRLN